MKLDKKFSTKIDKKEYGLDTQCDKCTALSSI